MKEETKNLIQIALDDLYNNMTSEDRQDWEEEFKEAFQLIGVDTYSSEQEEYDREKEMMKNE